MRFIKRLVIVLTTVMIAGLILVIGLLVTRLARAPVPMALPERIALPEGARADAVTLARDWVLVLSGDEVLLFDRATGALGHRMALPRRRPVPPRCRSGGALRASRKTFSRAPARVS